MGATCRSLTKGFPSWLKLRIYGAYIHLGKHLLCAWFVHANAASYGFLPYSISATQHGQPGPLPQMHVTSQPSLRSPDQSCACLHP